VHRAGVVAGDLDAGDELQAELSGAPARRRDAVLSVVVGKGKRREPSFGSQLHYFFWCVAAVRDAGVGMKVHHRANGSGRYGRMRT
jgi:hypothetical protein